MRCFVTWSILLLQKTDCGHQGTNLAVGQRLRLRGTERAVGMRVQSHDRHLDRDRRLRHLLDTTAQQVLRRSQQITVPLLGCCRPGSTLSRPSFSMSTPSSASSWRSDSSSGCPSVRRNCRVTCQPLASALPFRGGRPRSSSESPRRPPRSTPASPPPRSRRSRWRGSQRRAPPPVASLR